MRDVRSLAKKLFGIYLGIGGFFFLPMEISYMWAAANALWNVGFMPAIFVLVVGSASSALRMILWLPDFLSWLFTDNSYSFWQWLAPGFDSGVRAAVAIFLATFIGETAT